MRYIFIDGYNVINHWKELKEISKKDLDSARKKLLDIMENYCDNRDNIIIVYDAYFNSNPENEEKVGKIKVVFTKEYEIADRYIERSIDKLGRRKNIYIVTNDALEQMTAFQRGATRVSCREFYLEVRKREKSTREEIKNMNIRNKMLLEDHLDKGTIEKLEKIRKGG